MNDDAVRDLFAFLFPISIKRMFGGRGVVHEGRMIAIVMDGELYLKTSPDSLPIFERAGSSPFSYLRTGRLVATSYWRAPDAALDAPDEMRRWADLAIAAAAAQRAPPRREGRATRSS